MTLPTQALSSLPLEQNQNFQERLNNAVDLLAKSNSYHTKAKVANYISHSLTLSAWATAAFADALGGYNDKYVISLSLFLASFIPSAFQRFFEEKTTELRALSQQNIDLAHGRNIIQLTRFVDPTIKN